MISSSQSLMKNFQNIVPTKCQGCALLQMALKKLIHSKSTASLCGKRHCKPWINVKSCVVWNHSKVTTDSVKQNPVPHIPVMKETVLKYLNPHNGQLIVDMTFGSGGHTELILDCAPHVRVVCVDRDPLAFSAAQDLAKNYSVNQILPFNGVFSELPRYLHDYGIYSDTVDAFLFDVGASSMQFDNCERGFSLSKDGPLDMRMDQNRIPDQVSALDVVNNMDVQDLSNILKLYGEEKKHKQIAHAIVEARYTFGKISTTKQLAAIVDSVFEGDLMRDKLYRHAHTATRTFQALRIFVNDELNQLNIGMHVAHQYLRPGGVCVAISFHSLEDRIVKRHFHGIEMTEKKSLSLSQKIKSSSNNLEKGDIENFLKMKWIPLERKIISPSEDECKSNPRSRSAKLRVAYKSHTP